MEITFVDPLEEGAFEKAIQENTRALFITIRGNPNSDVVDIEAVVEIAHRHNIPLVIDNTFGTPYLIRPIEYGADIVVHSATKFIGGHGTAIGGVIVDGARFTKAAGPAAFVTRIRAILLRDTGASLSPFHAFLFLQVETVHHTSVSAGSSQQKLYSKYFPNGGGSIFAFEIKGGKQEAKTFIDNLELFFLLANVADAKSLVIHPATATHAQFSAEEQKER